MYVKWLLRNARRSARDYLIYSITLILSVGLFYGFLSVASRHYGGSLPLTASGLEALGKPMRAAVPAVSLLIVFLVWYVNDFMHNRRQAEFALLMALGMEKRAVAWLCFYEMLIVCIGAILCGVPLGCAASQFISFIAAESFGHGYRLSNPLYPDTLMHTLAFFLLVFGLFGLKNLLSVHNAGIMGMLQSGRRADGGSAPHKQNGKGMAVPLASSAAIFAFLSALVCRLRLDVRLLGPVLLSMALSLVCFAAAACFCMGAGRGEPGSGWMAAVGICGLAQSAMVLLLTGAIESLVEQGAVGQAYLWVMPFSAVLLFGFSLTALFSNMPFLLGKAVEGRKGLRYSQLFLIGEIKSRTGGAAKTMGAVSCILIASIVLLGWAPLLAARTAKYHGLTSPFDVQALSVYRDPLAYGYPQGAIDYGFLSDYLLQSGYPAQSAAYGELYLADEGALRDGEGKPLLAVSVGDYNEIRELSGEPGVELDGNEYAVAWAYDLSPGRISELEETLGGLEIGADVLTKAPNPSYQDTVGLLLHTSRMEGVYIIPDGKCAGLRAVTSFYAANTHSSLPVDFAERFSEDVLAHEDSRGVLGEGQFYVRLQALQDREGISNALLIRLLCMYIALALMAICFTILSVQQLTGVIGQRKRFEILHRLGVGRKEGAGIVRLQMLYLFGTPAAAAILISACCLGALLAWEYEEYSVYVSSGQILRSFFNAYAVVGMVMGAYFAATYHLVKRKLLPKRDAH